MWPMVPHFADSSRVLVSRTVHILITVNINDLSVKILKICVEYKAFSNPCCSTPATILCYLPSFEVKTSAWVTFSLGTCIRSLATCSQLFHGWLKAVLEDTLCIVRCATHDMNVILVKIKRTRVFRISYHAVCVGQLQSPLLMLS